MNPPVALTIAGSDSGGGAGIEIDLKVFAALGIFGTCAITALTAQNTTGVRSTWEAPLDIIQDQITAVLDDFSVAAVKTGKLSSVKVVLLVASMLRERTDIPLVVDPVLVAKDGTKLLSKEGLMAVRDELAPLATVITPNIPEAEALTGMTIKSEEDVKAIAAKLRALGDNWVLIKGGHLEGPKVFDLLLGPEGEQALLSPRRYGGPYHGTGCALSAAIAAYLAQGYPVPTAVKYASDFLHHHLNNAYRLGQGAQVLHPQSIPIE